MHCSRARVRFEEAALQKAALYRTLVWIKASSVHQLFTVSDCSIRIPTLSSFHWQDHLDQTNLLKGPRDFSQNDGSLLIDSIFIRASSRQHKRLRSVLRKFPVGELHLPKR